jgi:hypothetical protein
MDILALRTSIAATLSSLIGTYTLANGSTTPAISVRGSGESLPAGTTVTGMEVVILRDPELQAIPSYQKGQAINRWTLYLVDWDMTASLQEAAGKLIWAWPGSNAVSINVPQSVGPRHQMRVDLQTNPETYP